ncbi:helix-turn-helix domain-containing protein [Francisella tularensis]|uniref:helix-turn-helix domain-containing protein n=1 Tax=Francisella tularensis TaxID=263 RepID=UPI0008F490C9|nr:helix-turn-helix domain-containing protein [Francisella tularensis]APA83258.1 hypothetical protein N894_1274 [Francisella tularensis subsp. novicida PA10-7858]
MSVRAIKWAFEQDISQAGYKLLLLSLADYANDDDISYPSFSTLQKKCTCSRSSVDRAIRFLSDNGFIQKVELKDYVGKKYNNKQNCYKLLVETSTKTRPVPKRDQYQNETNTSTKTRIDTSTKTRLKPSIDKPLINHNNKTTTNNMENIEIPPEDEKSLSVSSCPFSFDEVEDDDIDDDIEHEKNCLRYSLINLHLTEEQADKVVNNYPLDVIEEAIEATEQANTEHRIDTSPPRYLYGILKNYKRTA